MSNCLRPCGLEPARFLCPWDFLGKNTGVGCHFLLQWICQNMYMLFLINISSIQSLSHIWLFVTPWWRGTKKPLMKVKDESEKVGLKLNIQKTMIMASGSITSWEIDGETVETVSDFNFLGSKITADGDCSHEIERHLLLGRKVMTNLDSILKSRDITLSTKVHLVKATVFPVVMYRCESWTVKKAERRKIDAFELCCWRRLLRVQGTLKEIQPVHPKGDQSWVFIGRTDAEAETPKLWPPHVKNWLIGKHLMREGLGTGGEGDDRG